MFCTQCGSQNPDEANFCQKCGAQSGATGTVAVATPRTSIVAPAEARAALPAIHIPKNPLSIAQMMILFCALLVVVIPATGIYEWFIRGVGDLSTTVMATDLSNLVDSSSNSGPDVGKEFLQLFTLRIALESPLLLVSIYSGVMLWQKKPGALSRARIFLAALVVFLLCSHLLFPDFFNLSETYDATLAVEYWLTVLLLAVCCGLLFVSKEVKNYYEVPSAPAQDSKVA